jgi:hypothetical protein
MSKSLISTGINPNDGNGDTLLAGAAKVNSNFNEVYNAIGDGSNINVGSGKTVLSTNSSGYVGVGTTNATSSFQVYNGPSVIGTSSSTGTLDQRLQVFGGAYVSGNIGVGVTNPQHQLHLVGSGSTTLLVSGNARISGIITSGSATIETGPAIIGTATSTGTASQPLQVTGGAYISGSVGIGTTNPVAQHHVVGNQYVTGIATVGLAATSLPPSNSQMSFELLTDTKLRIKVKGSDGVLRMVDLTLS